MEPDDPGEPFTRYQNAMYRVVSMAGAALILILGVTGFVVGSTLDPRPPASFFVIDAAVTMVLAVWYLLGLRCRLDVAEDWVHVAGKYTDIHLDRADVTAIEADTSLWGNLQWSGRPLLVHHRTDGVDRTRKAFGCLPNAAADQDRVVTELQDALGHPDDRGASDLADAVGDHLTHDADPDDDTDDRDRSGSDALAAAVAERLATMTPEGDRSDTGGPVGVNDGRDDGEDPDPTD